MCVRRCRRYDFRASLFADLLARRRLCAARVPSQILFQMRRYTPLHLDPTGTYVYAYYHGICGLVDLRRVRFPHDGGRVALAQLWASSCCTCALLVILGARGAWRVGRRCLRLHPLPLVHVGTVQRRLRSQYVNYPAIIGLLRRFLLHYPAILRRSRFP